MNPLVGKVNLPTPVSVGASRAATSAAPSALRQSPVVVVSTCAEREPPQKRCTRRRVVVATVLLALSVCLGVGLLVARFAFPCRWSGSKCGLYASLRYSRGERLTYTAATAFCNGTAADELSWTADVAQCAVVQHMFVVTILSATSLHVSLLPVLGGFAAVNSSANASQLVVEYDARTKAVVSARASTADGSLLFLVHALLDAESVRTPDAVWSRTPHVPLAQQRRTVFEVRGDAPVTTSSSSAGAGAFATRYELGGSLIVATDGVFRWQHMATRVSIRLRQRSVLSDSDLLELEGQLALVQWHAVYGGDADDTDGSDAADIDSADADADVSALETGERRLALDSPAPGTASSVVTKRFTVASLSAFGHRVSLEGTASLAAVRELPSQRVVSMRAGVNVGVEVDRAVAMRVLDYTSPDVDVSLPRRDGVVPFPPTSLQLTTPLISIETPFFFAIKVSIGGVVDTSALLGWGGSPPSVDLAVSVAVTLTADASVSVAGSTAAVHIAGVMVDSTTSASASVQLVGGSTAPVSSVQLCSRGRLQLRPARVSAVMRCRVRLCAWKCWTREWTVGGSTTVLENLARDVTLWDECS